MHGLIANQLRSYAVSRYGRAAWLDALKGSAAPLPEGPPPLDDTVADETIVDLVQALASASGQSVPALLDDFGTYLAPALLRIYAPLVKQDWRTLDVIERVEEHIHTAVRHHDRNAGPPYLAARRLSPTEVEVVYTSPRNLCALAEGIVRGLAAHFGEHVTVSQTECMHRDDRRCLIGVRLSP